MNSNIKRVLVAILTTVVATCFMMFTAMNFGGNAFADQSYTPVEFTSTTDYDFVMQDGASVKVAGFNTGVESALRFSTKLDKAVLLDGEGGVKDGVKVVTIITLTELLEEAGINDSKFTVENLEGLDVKYSSIVFSSANGNLTSVEDGNYYVYNACLYNIQDKNYTKEFSARSYVTDENGTITQYTTYTYNPEIADNAGSLWDVADAYKASADDGDNGTVYGPNENMTEKAYVETLCQTYTITAQGFDGATSEFTVKHGQTIADNIDYASLKTALNVDGCAYVNGTVAEGDDSVAITKNTEITLGMNSLAFKAVETNGEITSYSVSPGTLTAQDTTVIRVPEKFNDIYVKSIPDNGFLSNTFITKVFLPDTLTSVGATAFRGCTALEYVQVRGAVSLDSNRFQGCDSLKTLVVGRRVWCGGAFNTTKESSKGQMNVFYDTVLGNTDGDNFKIESGSNLYSGKVYKYSANLNESGCFGYDENGEVYAYNENSYFAYDSSTYTMPSKPNLIHSPFIYALNSAGTGYLVKASKYFADYVSENGGNLEVPQQYNGKNVTGVAQSGFASQTTLISIVLPNTLTSIGKEAFSGCTALTYVKALGVSPLEGSDNKQFYGCDNLTKLVVGSRVFLGLGIRTGTSGYVPKLDIYWENTYINTGAAYMQLENSTTTLYTLRVYKYSETEAAGCYRYVDGIPEPWNVNSYYTHAGGKSTTLTAPTA